MSSSLQPHGLHMPSSLSFTICWSLLRLMSVESVMPSSHLILCCPLSSCFQSSPASQSFPMSQPFTSGSQTVGVSASASVLPVNFQAWFLLGCTDLISLLTRGLSSTRVWKHQFFSTAFFVVWLSHPYMTAGKTIALTRRTFVGKVMSLLF